MPCETKDAAQLRAQASFEVWRIRGLELSPHPVHCRSALLDSRVVLWNASVLETCLNRAIVGPMTGRHPPGHDPDPGEPRTPNLRQRSLNADFSLYRIAARTLCLRRPHPEPAASRVRVERISVPLHVPSSARITNEVINAAWWYLLHSVGPQPAAWLAGIRIPRPQMQAFRESTGLPPVAFCLDRVYPNGTGSNGAWYASSPDAAWSENAWDGEDRERPKVSVSPAKLTTFFLGPFFSSCARISGLGTLANPRGIGHCQIQMNGESTVDRRGFWSGPAVGLAMRSGAPGAWKLELVICCQRAGCGSAEAGSTDGWCHRNRALAHLLWSQAPERAARQGFRGTIKLFCKVILLRFDRTFANVCTLPPPHIRSTYRLDAGFRAVADRSQGGF